MGKVSECKRIKKHEGKEEFELKRDAGKCVT